MTPQRLREELGTGIDPARALGEPEAELGLYVHVPFCARRCAYCDFVTCAGLDGWQTAYVAALEAEMARWSAALAFDEAGRGGATSAPPRRPVVTSVYVGGGTPTWLGPGLLERLIESVRRDFLLASDCEVTVEANPGTTDRDRLASIRDQGVTRLSLGAQSFLDGELGFLGRIHNADDIRASYSHARAAGFDNVSLDVIFGLPEQDRSAWDATLDAVAALRPEHVSAYQLTVEPGTPLHRSVTSGAIRQAGEDVGADLYEHTMDRLAAAGYVHYEVSSWSRATAGASGDRSFACRHNVLYWRNGPYLGFGAGAHGHATLVTGPRRGWDLRWANVPLVAGYLNRIAKRRDPGAWCERIDPATAMGESMMLGLRMVGEGVPHERFRHRHGVDPRAQFAEQIEALSRMGLLTVDETATVLTRRGWMLGNQVFERFLP